MSTAIAITPQQERIFQLVNDRLDQLDTAAAPSVYEHPRRRPSPLPPADRIYVHRRLMAIGHPDTEWASALHDD